MSAKNALFELIQKASATDLQEIDEHIDGLQAEVDKAQEDIDRLRSLRKTIDILVNGKPERKKRESKPGSSKSPPPNISTRNQDLPVSKRRELIARYLAKNGPASPPDIAEALDLEKQNIHFLLNHEAFAKSGQGWNITAHGRNTYLES